MCCGLPAVINIITLGTGSSRSFFLIPIFSTAFSPFVQLFKNMSVFSLLACVISEHKETRQRFALFSKLHSSVRKLQCLTLQRSTPIVWSSNLERVVLSQIVHFHFALIGNDNFLFFNCLFFFYYFFKSVLQTDVW